MKYASELNPPRQMLIIVNKSDLLSEYQRSQWAAEFGRLGIKALFYSAHAEQEKLDKAAAAHEPIEDELLDVEELNALVDDIELQLNGVNQYQCREEDIARMNDIVDESAYDADKDDESSDEEPETFGDEEPDSDDVEVVWGDGVATSMVSSGLKSLMKTSGSSRGRILTRGELIFILKAISSRLELDPQPRHNGRICVGLVGYPNVGKSSVINTILGVSKMTHGTVRVAVSLYPHLDFFQVQAADL